MMWLGLKRGKIKAEIYHEDKYIMTIDVAEHNRSNLAYIALTNCKGVKFKIIKEENKEEVDESVWNSEKYNV